MDTSGIITLTTDFGLADNYVGQMKGAALSVNPEIRIVDLTHGVPAQDLHAGAYAIETGYAAFPVGTVHVVVVDPGVGTERRMVAVEAGGHLFLSPDNGILTRVLEREKPTAAHAIQNDSLFDPGRSRTFAGRDVFAPAAAWITRGIGLDRLGPPAVDIVKLDYIRPRIEFGRRTQVPVIHVDQFGNVVLDVTLEHLTAVLGHPPDAASHLVLQTDGGEVRSFFATYAESKQREPFFLVNSAGYLEVAVDRGRADRRLGLHRGMAVALQVGGNGG